MPRQPRLDIPDLLHHVIVRGINRSSIFRDVDDRRNFVDRFSRLLKETGTQCYTWALSTPTSAAAPAKLRLGAFHAPSADGPCRLL